MKTIGISTMENFGSRKLNSVGSSRIRARWLLPYWEEAEEYIIGKKYEVMIYQKVYWENMMEAFEGIQILDLADPDWLENRDVFRYVDWADAVVTSTPQLAEYIQKLRPNHKHVLCIPDRVYLPESTPVKADYGDKLQELVWFGYAQNAHYLTNTFEELIRRGLNVTAISEQPIEVPAIYRNKIRVDNVPFNYATLNKEIIERDAILMPDPSGDERAKYKSNNKTLQAWALGMPVIKVPEDLDVFETGEARRNEGQKRRKEIEEKWDVRFSVDDYRQLIETLKKERTAK